MSKEKQTITTLDLSTLGKPNRPKSTEGNPLSKDREESAYKRLATEAVSMKEFLQDSHAIKRSFYVYHNNKFIVSSNKNIQYTDSDMRTALVEGKATAAETFVMDGTIDSAKTIHDLFFNAETSPRTKCHSYWFGIEDNKPVFCALQGDSIKICR